ncbi:MAG: ATP-binding protein [Xanthomonadales bacterium]|jgi:hypothetical protein|nr:ATP-binding protein [Xanthomonadales bacterium]
MLKHLQLQNVGPAAALEIDFAPRLNVLTGDNGLGKSFLLDIAFWALTRRWPGEVNRRLYAGRQAVPAGPGEAQIGFSFTGKGKEERYVSQYRRREEAWTGRPGRPANPGLVFYAMSDGSFAVWDPARNYWRTRGEVDIQERVPAYVFSPTEVWNGLDQRAIADPSGRRRDEEADRPLSLGLIMDWAGWQKEKSEAYAHLVRVLEALSPSARERLTPGALRRISLDDARDVPTIRMPYGQEVPVLYASAGMRRILALAYVLVWAWEEHCQAARLLDEAPTRQVVLLVDELESHLHPRWQRRIVPSLLQVASALVGARAELQLIATTHSPLVMASIEPLFDVGTDAWWDLDLERGQVVLRPRPFEKRGDAAQWLTSAAFDLSSSRSVEAEALLEKAATLLEAASPDRKKIVDMNRALVAALPPTDDFLFNWRYVCRTRGWLE